MQSVQYASEYNFDTNTDRFSPISLYTYRVYQNDG